MLDLSIASLASAHDGFLASLRSSGEGALLDYARETLPDLVAAVGPETEADGKSSVTSDILKVVIPGDEGPFLGTSVASLVGSRRWNGKVRRNYARKIIVPRADFNQYEARKHRNVGLTAAGYVVAARELGITLPAWIAEHASEGDFRIELAGDVITVNVINAVPWAAYLPGALARTGYAIHVKSGKLYDLCAAAMDGAAAERGF